MKITILFGAQHEVDRLDLGLIIRKLNVDVLMTGCTLSCGFVEGVIRIRDSGHTMLISTDESIKGSDLKDLQSTYPEIEHIVNAQMLLPRPVMFKNWQTAQEDITRLNAFHEKWNNLTESDGRLGLMPSKLGESIGELPWASSGFGFRARGTGKSIEIAKSLANRAGVKLSEIDKVWIDEAVDRREEWDSFVLSQEPPFKKRLDSMRRILDEKLPGWKPSYFKSVGDCALTKIMDAGFGTFNIEVPQSTIRSAYPNMTSEEILADIRRLMKLLKDDTTGQPVSE